AFHHDHVGNSWESPDDRWSVRTAHYLCNRDCGNRDVDGEAVVPIGNQCHFSGTHPGVYE
ncbi:hypothetical protein T265_16282, partial [Opisthorchis viverrini]